MLSNHYKPEVPANYQPRPAIERDAWGFPRLRLITHPTRCHPMLKLGNAWGHPALFVKREDQTAGLYGGNKVRNLEYILAEAELRGARDLLTVAPLGSNFVAALASHAPGLGFRVKVRHFVPHRNPQIESHADFSAAQGAALLISNDAWPVPLAALTAGCASLIEHRRTGAYWVSPGGSNVIGAMGHFSAALELKEQILRKELPAPDLLVVGVGTCGTIAGLLAGLRVSGLSTRVIGIRCVDRIVCNRRRISALANQLLRQLGLPANVSHRDIDLRSPDGNSMRYAERSASAGNLAAQFSATEGLTLDTTYTTKVAKCLEAIVSSPEAKKRTVLYWHTYGGRNIHRGE